MKFIFKKILQYYLKYITKFVLFIHRSTIIAIAGSTNKIFVKNEINHVLQKQGISVRSNPRSFNTEIGLPLAILNLPSGYNSYKNWLPIIFKAFLKIFQFNFPRVLVLELGVSDPGDMRYLLSITKPDIAVITDITQRYLEGFDDMDEIAGEYEYLIKKINKKGLTVLNYNNPRVKKMAKISKNKVISFGIKHDVDWQVAEIKKESGGQRVKIRHNNIISEHKINRFGNHHIYALLIGLIVKDYVKEKKKI